MVHDKSMKNLEKLERMIGKFPARNYLFYSEKLGWSKSKFYDYIGTLQNQKKVYSKNGAWYPKHAPTEEKSSNSIRPGLGLFGWWEKRAERKKLERENERELINREIAELECRRAIYHEKFQIKQKLPLKKRNNPLPIEQEKAIEKKWRKYYGLE